MKKKTADWIKNNPERYAKVKAVYRAANADKLSDAQTARRADLKGKEVSALRDKHNGRCDICETDNPGKKRKRLSMDHCHKTGKVRGFLCNTCNRGIGLLKDDVEVLRKAILYLERSGNE